MGNGEVDSGPSPSHRPVHNIVSVNFCVLTSSPPTLLEHAPLATLLVRGLGHPPQFLRDVGAFFDLSLCTPASSEVALDTILYRHCVVFDE